MKKIIAAFLFVTVLMSCGSKKKTYDDYMGIADKVEMKEHEGYIQFPNTRIIMVMPEGYELNASYEKPRVLKTKQDYQSFIDVTEEPTEGIDEVKNVYEHRVDEMKEKKPEAVCKIKDFKLGDYDARFVYISNYGSYTEEALLMFGNEKYSAIVGATIRDQSLKKEIMEIMLTAYIKPGAKPDETPFACYTIDLLGTKFKFNSLNNENIHMYTGNGDNIGLSDSKNVMLITQFPDSIKSTLDDRKDIANYIIKGMMENDRTMSNRQEQVTLLNNGEAYEIILDKTIGKAKSPGKFYLLCFAVGGRTFLLEGDISEDFDETIAQFRRIAKSMKLK